MFNAANEVAVEAFVNREIGFEGISELVRKTMDSHKAASHPAWCRFSKRTPGRDRSLNVPSLSKPFENAGNTLALGLILL